MYRGLPKEIQWFHIFKRVLNCGHQLGSPSIHLPSTYQHDSEPPSVLNMVQSETPLFSGHSRPIWQFGPLDSR